MFLEVLLDRAIKRRQGITLGQMQNHRSDIEAAAVRSFEPAVSVAEAAIAASQRQEVTFLGIKSLNCSQSLGNFLAVSADILDRRRAGRAGNQAKRLNTG